jgi:hypothetical protein
MKFPTRLRKLRALVVALENENDEQRPIRVRNLAKRINRELANLKRFSRERSSKAYLAIKAKDKRQPPHCETCGRFEGAHDEKA